MTSGGGGGNQKTKNCTDMLRERDSDSMKRDPKIF